MATTESRVQCSKWYFENDTFIQCPDDAVFVVEVLNEDEDEPRFLCVKHTRETRGIPHRATMLGEL